MFHYILWHFGSLYRMLATLEARSKKMDEEIKRLQALETGVATLNTNLAAYQVSVNDAFAALKAKLDPAVKAALDAELTNLETVFGQVPTLTVPA